MNFSNVIDDEILSDLPFLLKLSEFDFEHYDSIEFLENKISVTVQTEKSGSDKATQVSANAFSTSKSIQTTENASYSPTITFKVNCSAISMEIFEVPQYTIDFSSSGRETIVVQMLMKVSSRRPLVILNSPTIRYKNTDIQVSAHIKPCEEHKKKSNCGESTLCFVVSCVDNGVDTIDDLVPKSSPSLRRFQIELVNAVDASKKKSSDWVYFSSEDYEWESLLSSVFFRKSNNWVDSNECFSVIFTAIFNS